MHNVARVTSALLISECGRYAHATIATRVRRAVALRFPPLEHRCTPEWNPLPVRGAA
jgi:hypothetical protein